MAASRLIAPVGTASTRTFSFASIRMIEPLPQLFSIWAIARFSAFFLSSAIVDTAIRLHPLVVVDSSGHADISVSEKQVTRYPNKVRRPGPEIKPKGRAERR